MFQICCCGTQPGYQHPEWCPFPCYGNLESQIEEWTKQLNKAIDAEQAVGASGGSPTEDDGVKAAKSQEEVD